MFDVYKNIVPYQICCELVIENATKKVDGWQRKIHIP